MVQVANLDAHDEGVEVTELTLTKDELEIIVSGLEIMVDEAGPDADTCRLIDQLKRCQQDLEWDINGN